MGHVSVIMPFHREDNKEYLKLSLRSLKEQDKDQELKVIVSTNNQSCFIKAQELISELKMSYGIVIFNEDAQTFAKKMNKAAEHIDSKSEFVLLFQDDVVLSQGCLNYLTTIIKTTDKELMINPVSNAEIGVLIVNPISIKLGDELLELSRHMSLEDFKGKEDALLGPIGITPLVFKTAWLAGYCTLMRKSLWDKIGGFDEQFIHGHEDIDLCMRAVDFHGANCAVAMGTFCLHFQSVTDLKEGVGKREHENNKRKFKEKWRNKN